MGPPTILYIGTLSWPPNVNAVRFLVDDVLPRVRRSLPGARLTVVGKTPPPEIQRLAREDGRITVAANVDDVMPYFRDAHVLAVPLQAGGGTRLKILEAFAAGLPVVSTAVGCEGLRVQDGQHLVVAEREDFAGAIASLLSDPARAQALAERARVVARERYDWHVVGERACDAVLAAATGGPVYHRAPTALAMPTVAGR
jgi:glycosyltransferase involved in cell wall biosynthesis